MSEPDAARQLHAAVDAFTSVLHDYVEGSGSGEDDAPPDWEDFFLHVVVGTGPGTSPESLDHVLQQLDDAGAQFVQLLLEAGYVVPSFDTSRGHDAFEDDEEDE